MGILTPQTVPVETTIRALRIPLGADWLSIVGGALSVIGFVKNWSQEGSVTPYDAAQVGKQIINSFYEGSGMIGSIMPYASAAPPPLMLPCDGGTFLREDYPLLYAVLATEFIDDADHFTLPDLQGRTVIGAGAGSGLTVRQVNDIGGTEDETLTVEQLPAHDHTTDPHAHTINATDILSALATGDPNAAWTTTPIGTVNTNDKTVIVNETGGDEPHNNMPPFVALNWGIVYA